MSIGITTYSQVLCYTYDAAGNRRIKVSGSCDAPSGLVAPPTNNAAVDLASNTSQRSETIESMQVGDNAGIIVPNPTSSTFEIRLHKAPVANSFFELSEYSQKDKPDVWIEPRK